MLPDCIPLKNVKYDIETGEQEIERQRREMPIINKKNRAFNIRLAIILLLAIAAPINLGAWWLVGPGGFASDVMEHPVNICYLAVALLISLTFVFAIYADKSKLVLTENEWYSANAKFYKLTHMCNILKIEPKRDTDDEVYLVLTLEDEHIVHTKYMYTPTVTLQTRTDITEPTLDLTKGALYIPYTA
jgi:hypothetical protein